MLHGYHRKSGSGLSEAISLLAFLVFLGLVGNVLTAHTLRDWGCPDFVEGRKGQVTTDMCSKAIGER
jgi:hypothetical protein